MQDDRGILEALLSNGRYLLSLTGFVLAFSGCFAIFQSLTGYFLPQDVHALGFDAAHLAAVANHHVVHFMFHDRVAFGGTLLAVGIAYWFLAEFPLRAGEPWAWWAFCLSGICGFASFLCYLGYGYLDTWHAIATLGLIPVYLAGLWRARPGAIDYHDAWRSVQRASPGRLGLGFLAAGLMAAGATIMVVGMTSVFRSPRPHVHANDAGGDPKDFSEPCTRYCARPRRIRRRALFNRNPSPAHHAPRATLQELRADRCLNGICRVWRRARRSFCDRIHRRSSSGAGLSWIRLLPRDRGEAEF